MATLTKTTTVLDRVEGTFSYRQVGDVGDVREHVVILDPDVYLELGRPSSITVTIEPGDQLND